MSHDMSHAATFSSCGSGVMWRMFLRSSRIRSMTMMSSSSRSSHSCEGGRKEGVRMNEWGCEERGEWVRVWCDRWVSEDVRTRVYVGEKWTNRKEFAAIVSLPSGTTQRAQTPGHAPHSLPWTPSRDTQERSCQSMVTSSFESVIICVVIFPSHASKMLTEPSSVHTHF